ncbi:MAG TPA: glycosyltransferase family 1 protein [Microbacteriaceae bacterium]|nr:glycosyltransferase family 1 protein [Microbacteriaceae bacterium]
MTRLVVDCRYVRVGRHDGISRYTAGVVTALLRRHPVTMLICDKRQLTMLPKAPWAMARRPTSVWEPLVALRVNRLRPDVVFSPMQTMGSIGRRYRLILTVHDLIYYRHRTPPRDLPAFVRLLWRFYHLSWWPQRLLLNGADAVVTVSETTKSLIAEHRLTRRPVEVVPNAADELPGSPADAAPHDGPQVPGPGRDLVYMGSFMPYKDVDTLVRAAALLPGYRLHLMSRAGGRERDRLTSMAKGAVLVFHDGASDAEYLATLRQAAALVTASRDEGFGIPLLEAMRAGTPVVVSDIPIFREIGGDAALYAEPGDAAAFAARIRLLRDPAVRAGLIEAGRKRAADFSWDRSAATLLGLARRLVAGPREDPRACQEEHEG